MGGGKRKRDGGKERPRSGVGEKKGETKRYRGYVCVWAGRENVQGQGKIVFPVIQRNYVSPTLKGI